MVSTAEGIISDKPLHFFLERYNGAYIEETEQFIESLLNGQPLPVTGNDGVQAERIALAAKLSCRLGRPVKISEAVELQRQTEGKGSLSKLIVKPKASPDQDGIVLSVTPESAGWKYVGFEVAKLEAGQMLKRDTGDLEYCLVLLTGKADVARSKRSGKISAGG